MFPNLYLAMPNQPINRHSWYLDWRQEVRSSAACCWRQEVPSSASSAACCWRQEFGPNRRKACFWRQEVGPNRRKACCSTTSSIRRWASHCLTLKIFLPICALKIGCICCFIAQPSEQHSAAAGRLKTRRLKSLCRRIRVNKKLQKLQTDYTYARTKKENI